ncbi:preprotein translocase subunit SecE [Candidatus Saccharibacteria bacterium]|nr:preprotein translocase subunit SecE [Candidatus Saccharibacteria bacterium]
MANITRIKAKDPSKPKSEESSETPKTVLAEDKKAEKKLKKAEKNAEKLAKKAEKREKNSGKKPFILFRPFVALGHYLRDSWHELRQVRWLNRKATWKMVLAVFVYTVVFVVFLMLLDLLFDFIFSKLLG